MSQKISEFYPWLTESNLSSQFILCLDRNNGEFSFVYLLLKFIRQGIKVKLLCCRHHTSHYESILRKNNLDVSKLEATGKLVLNCIEFDQHDTTGGAKKALPSSLTWQQLVDWKSSGFPFVYKHIGMPLIADAATDIEPLQESYVLLIDDVEMLELMAPSAGHARRFCASCINSLNRNNTSSRKNNAGILEPPRPLQSIVMFGRHPIDSTAAFSSMAGSSNSAASYTQNTYSDDSNETLVRGFGNSKSGSGAAAAGIGGGAAFDENACGDDEAGGQPALAEYLRYRAEVTITVSALESGFSSAVHGIIKIVTEQPTKAASADGQQLLQYRSLDSGVLVTVMVGDRR